VLARLPGQTEQAVHLRRMMERQMRLMVKLIDELLDVSRISTGKVVLQSERVDMRQVVASALEGSRPLVDSARHVLDVRQPDGPVWTFGDPARLSQVVSNLVNNAAKYTPDGGRIEVALNQQGNEAVLTVSDTGVGLPGDKLEEVFEMFSQVNRTLERSQGGLGIGLSLVRKLLELHGGSVAARSPGPDQGSTFTVRLPMLDATDGPAGPRPASHIEPSRKSCRLLIIDDNEDAADAIAALAASEGHVARTAYSAAAGLAAASEFHPDVIICDIGMPQMDGYQLAARLRQEPELAQAMLVAVTGWGGEAARGRSLQAGFDRHLTKPMTYEAFTALFADR
jgi:CheY-like chemotaxis protein